MSDLPNAITVTGTASDARANLSSSCTAQVTVPTVTGCVNIQDWGECTFEKNPKKPWRVDNDCKDTLDKLALRLQQMPNGKLDIVGYTDEKEVVSEQTLGSQRSVNVKYYLTTDGPTKVDAGRIQPRQGGTTPAFQFDLKRLTRIDQIVGVASFIVLISIFLPWFSISVGAFGSFSGSGTDAHGWLWLVFVLDLAIIGYLVLRAGWEESQSPVRVPVAHDRLLMAAAGLQLLLILIAFFDMPSGFGWDWGAFIGLLAAIAAAAVLVPAVRSRIENR